MAESIIKRRSLRRRNPLGFMRSGLDSLFDNFFHEFGIEPLSSASDVADFVPRMDIVETDEEYKIAAELPGLEKEDVELDLDDDILTIMGEKKSELEENAEGRHHIERSYGSFSRSFKLPRDAEREHVDAEFKNGVLEIHLHKTDESKAQARKISIK